MICNLKPGQVSFEVHLPLDFRFSLVEVLWLDNEEGVTWEFGVLLPDKPTGVLRKFPSFGVPAVSEDVPEPSSANLTEAVVLRFAEFLTAGFVKKNHLRKKGSLSIL